ncbi:NAD(P)H-dependent amine dehydrogenase family protein [Rhodococcus sp. UNC363MFTsu5.1]|uniref:NAD(P)H-dependent amine dehydrogenase family protein n=1 Tax=Rhodococcus sp. UNC363MFTsu5.1 TaxID=1449069 RepID=UPI00068BD072|nr:dihydrodipicolinate reductase [Rhodococcus sp. UNC363MFTsu5.1]
MISTIVWGTGNFGRAAIRAVDAHPGLELAAVLVHDPGKVGRDAGELGGLDRELGVVASRDAAAVLAAGPRAVVYAASGDIRSADVVADICAALLAGAIVVTPSIYPLYDHRDDRQDLREEIRAALADGTGSLFVTCVDPDWTDEMLPLLLSGLGADVDRIHCQEIVDYSGYDQPDSVRYLVGMGEPLDYLAPMIAPRMPTTVWGGQVRLMARALGVELDEIRESLERRPLEASIETDTMGKFDAGGQGALRLQVQGIVGGEPRIVIEHVNRIDPTCAPDWPSPPEGQSCAQRVLVEGGPRIAMIVVGAAPDAGEDATSVSRLVGAIDWLAGQAPGFYDALDVPLRPTRAPELADASV